MSTEVATQNSQEIENLLQQQEAELVDAPFRTPILKIGQPLTQEVQSGDAEAGEFINTATGASIGDSIGFIIAYYERGRFTSDDDSGRAFVAFDSVIPETWEPVLGSEWVGTPFNEHPESEEVFKQRVNNKEIEWGSGPKISTTHNYTGFAVVSAEESEEGEEELQPVRLSLKRIDVPAVRKISTLKRAMLRNKPFWEIVFDLSTTQKSFTKGTSYLLNVKPGRKTTAEERSQAAELALAVSGGNVVSNDEAAEDVEPAATEPDAEGGLSV